IFLFLRPRPLLSTLFPYTTLFRSWDIVFIIEPVMLGFLVLGLIIPGLFSLIDKEIGARRHQSRGKIAATLALFGVVFMWGIRDYEHRRAINLLNARIYN